MGRTIRVEVRLFTRLRSYLPPGGADGSVRLELEEGSTIRDLEARLSIPAAKLRVALVNGSRRPEDWVLADGDTVAILEPAGGG
jgi:molybdopterin converting factor small subunit